MAAMLVRPRRVARIRGSAANRRRSAWATSATHNTAIAAAGGQVFDLLSTFTLASATASMGVTVTRTLLSIRWEPTNLADFTTWGIIMSNVNQEFDDIHPNLNPSLSWAFLHESFPLASATTPDAARVEQFDLRSRRRLGNMENRYVLSVFNPAGTPRNVSFYCRTLVLLP